MNTEKILFREEVFRIVGAAMAVLNELGRGLHEKPYLRISGLTVGLLLNFRRAKLEWERIVLSDHSR